MSGKEFVLDIDYVKHDTEKAMLVALPNGEEMWLPKSQIIDDNSLEQPSTLTITHWIARQKELLP